MSWRLQFIEYMLKHQLLHFWQEMTRCSCWRKQSGRFKAHFMAFKSGHCFSLIVSHLNSRNFYDLSISVSTQVLKFLETTLVIHLTYPAQRFKGYFSPAEFHSTFLSWFSFSTVLFSFHFQLFFINSSLKDNCINLWKHSGFKVLQWKFTSDQGEKRHPADKN